MRDTRIPTATITTPFLENFNVYNAGWIAETGQNGGNTISADPVVKKYGDMSAKGQGYANFPIGTVIDFGSGDFTIDQWIYPTSAGLAFTISAIKNGMHTGPFCILYNEGTLRFFADSGANNWNISNNQIFGTPALNQWSHIAVTRTGTSFKAFLNGVQGLSFTSSLALTSMSGSPLTLGARAGAGGINNRWVGNLGPVRISNVCHWASNFIPPTNLYYLV
jgi:hypothetical protein